MSNSELTSSFRYVGKSALGVIGFLRVQADSPGLRVGDGSSSTVDQDIIGVWRCDC